MEKLEKKMARFVELSMKFSVGEDLIEEIQDLKDLVPPPTFDGITLTSTGTENIWLNDAALLDQGKENDDAKTFRELVEEGVTDRWKVYEDFKEYKGLQETLNTYFKALKKI